MKSLSSMFAECLGLKIKGRHLHLASLLIAFVALFASSALAQEATILGTVNDSSGAAVPNVQVVITNTETGIVTDVNTSGDGQYVAPAIHIGHYTVRVAASGFKAAEQKNITLSVGDRTRIDFKLQVGGVQEQVTVEANAVAVQTDTGEVSNLITGGQISISRSTARAYFNLLPWRPAHRTTSLTTRMSQSVAIPTSASMVSALPTIPS